MEYFVGIAEVCMLLIYYFSKDVRLPVQLQRAMAAEAEAAREARAKVCIQIKYHLYNIFCIIPQSNQKS